MPNPTYLPANRVQLTDAQTNIVSREWYLFFQNVLALAEAGGGGGGSGTVTAVDVSGGATGLTTSGGPVTTSGTIALGGTLNVLHGGTGSTTASGARTNLGLVIGVDVPSTSGSGASGSWSINAATVTNGVYTTGSYADPTWITTLAGTKITGNITGNAANVTGTVAIANGGTGQVTQADAITALAGTQTTGYYLRSDGTNTALAAIQAADVPTLNQNTTGQAGSVANALTVGTGLSYSAGTTYNGSAAITIDNAAPMVYPGAGIPNSTGTAWGASYTTTGSGTTLVLDTSPSLITPLLGTPTSGNFSTGTFTWPTFNQNTTGTASNVTGVVAILNGGTGQTTATLGFDALAPTTTKGDLIVRNGTGNIRLGVGTDTYVLTADSTTASGIKWAIASGGGVTIANDTTTATNEYPLYAAATSGSLTTAYTSNAKYLYKPSTGELTSEHFVAGNGIFVNKLAIATSYTIAAGYSGSSAGPITINTGITVTVSTGSRWVVI